MTDRLFSTSARALPLVEAEVVDEPLAMLPDGCPVLDGSACAALAIALAPVADEIATMASNISKRAKAMTIESLRRVHGAGDGVARSG